MKANRLYYVKFMNYSYQNIVEIFYIIDWWITIATTLFKVVILFWGIEEQFTWKQKWTNFQLNLFWAFSTYTIQITKIFIIVYFHWINKDLVHSLQLTCDLGK